MKLAVIIVNYNVKYFLDQCIESVLNSVLPQDVTLEVAVVDNNSSDGSVEMVREHYPQVRLYANSDNPGFAKANNQALRDSDADYMLLLNPDTLVEHDTLAQCLEFYQSHPDCGGLSVKMVNGEGTFLKESKRGFPSPKTSFYKICGLIRIFPHNKKIAAYYMGHIGEGETSEVEILPGAFLMISREALEKVGYLDESYFMYGEDIDFSWRIHLAGYKNYYLPTTRILHYKGECTKKGSMNYVYTFYNAMVIFTKRYFSGSGAKLFTLLIQLAIWARASLAFLQRIAKHLAVPCLDFMAAFAGFVAIKQLWATYWADNVNYYPSSYTWCILPIYILILMLATFLCGGYDKPLRLGRIAKGMGLGACLLLAFYSLLDETLRYSRAIVLFGSIWTLIAALGIRGILGLLKVDGYNLHPYHKRRYLIVGSNEEQQRVTTLFDSLGIQPRSIAYLTDTQQLVSQQPQADEIIFCSQDIAIHDILDTLETLHGSRYCYRIAPADRDFLIGSNYTSSPEELYTDNTDSITTVTNRRNKRLFDLTTAALALLLSPILFWFQRHKRHYFPHCCSVLVGRRTWVGYSQTTPTFDDGTPLPHLKPGVLQTHHLLPLVKHPDLQRLDQSYAQDYHVATDLQILFRNLYRL